MKASLALLALFGVLLISLSEAAPQQQEQQQQTFEYGVFKPPVADHGDRHKRFTCDVLSFETQWISFNHAACAAHCLALMKGYRGGYCDEKGICVCRK